mmetsp:Transcript_43545/g.81069  ORF Transcript_43545/g.81069 Transcript_43545/m.81069 type:complete len:81 (+) Transcript_43545:67-309(+)
MVPDGRRRTVGSDARTKFPKGQEAHLVALAVGEVYGRFESMFEIGVDEKQGVQEWQEEAEHEVILNISLNHRDKNVHRML